MGMSMSFGMRMSQSHALSIEQRMEVAQAVGGVLIQIGRELGMPTRGYEAMRTRTASSIRDHTLSVGVSSLLDNRGVRQTIIASPEYTTVQNKDRLAKLMVDATFEYHRGDFAGLATTPDLLQHPGKVARTVFASACLNPDDLTESIEAIRFQIRQSGASTQFQLAHIDEMSYCAQIAELTKEDREKGALLLKLALNRLESDKLSPLMRYSRELVFQREYLPFITDRLLDRAAKNIVQRAASPENMEKGLRLCVCEFVLAAMGVVPPGLSHPGDGEIRDEIGNAPKKSEDELGFSIANEFKRRMKSRSPISLNESVVEIGARGSDLVSSFLGGAFADSWPGLLESLGGKTWLEALRAEGAESKERTTTLDSLFVAGLNAAAFQEMVKKLIVSSWYPALDPYLQWRITF